MRVLWLSCIFVLSLTGACGSTSKTQVDQQRDVTNDVAAVVDVQDSSTGSDQVEIDSTADVLPSSCESPRECGNKHDCLGSKCVLAPTCETYLDCDADKACVDGRCIVRCEIDTDCKKGQVCVDALCHTPKWLTGTRPNEGLSERKPIKVGVASIELDHPLSVSMGGYGFRAGPKGPYASILGSSTGMFERFKVKVVVIDNGVERIALVRSPLVFTTDFVVTRIAQRIIEKTGIDFTNRLLVVSTHSHSAPARFWNLMTGKKIAGISFGLFGFGDFSAEIFTRMVDSFADAVIAANSSLKPGKLGYGVLKDFDPKGHIYSDRRGESIEYKFPYLLVVRIDDAAGKPLAALVNFPMHSTINETSSMSNDAAGGLEFVVQERLEEIHNTPIEVLFMQGSAGDISPRGDQLGHKLHAQMQMIGHLASKPVADVFGSIKTTTDWPIEMVNRRVGLSRKLLGYQTGEFYDEREGEKQVHRYGAFQCVNASMKGDDKHVDGKLGCILDVQTINGNPIPQFSKTRFTSLRLGSLVLSSFPGEVTSILANQLREHVIEKSGGKLADVFVFGYAQDHQFYFVESENWFKGGTEAQSSMWGWRIGDYVFGHAASLTLQLGTDEKEDNRSDFLRTDYFELDLTATVPREETPTAGTIIAEPRAVYKRFGLSQTFVLSGGFVGVDHPHVTLQRKAGQNFVDVKRRGGQRNYDDSDYRMVMKFKRKDVGVYHYTYVFSELQDFPTGTYRFRISGKKWLDNKTTSYTANTAAFEIEPAERLVFNHTLSDALLRIALTYPAATNDDGVSAFGRLERRGHRLYSTVNRWQLGAPVAGKISYSIVIKKDNSEVKTLTGTDVTLTEKNVKLRLISDRAQSGDETLTDINGFAGTFELDLGELANGNYVLEFTVTDRFMNVGKATIAVSLNR